MPDCMWLLATRSSTAHRRRPGAHDRFRKSLALPYALENTFFSPDSSNITLATAYEAFRSLTGTDPASVELLVEYTEPGLQGDRSTGGTKPAKLETGHEIAVPLFITTGEKIKVDTRDSSYLGRVSS